MSISSNTFISKEPQWIYTVKNAARRLSLSERQVRRYIKSGKLIAYYKKVPVEVRMLMIPGDSLEAFKENYDLNRHVRASRNKRTDSTVSSNISYRLEPI